MLKKDTPMLFVNEVAPRSLCTLILAAVVGLAATRAGAAGNLVVTQLPNGYTSGSVELGADFAGALTQDPANANRLLVSVGSFGAQSILSVNVATQSTATVATGFGSIGGIAVLSNGDLAVTENFTSKTIVRARDLDSDGKFLSAGELTTLIAPILDDGNFSGAQCATAPPGNASVIPAGALVVQTADGGTSGELLVITNPETAPAYRPAGGAYAAGLDYNGGFGFDPAGNIICGSSGFFSGQILALVNSNANQQIDAGERSVLVGGGALGLGLTDLSVSKENAVFFGENSGDVRRFALPANLLTGTGTPTLFARTNSTYLSVVRLDFPDRPFAPGSAGSTARLYLTGYLPGFATASNIAFIQPAPLTAVADWSVYE